MPRVWSIATLTTFGCFHPNFCLLLHSHPWGLQRCPVLLQVPVGGEIMWNIRTFIPELVGISYPKFTCWSSSFPLKGQFQGYALFQTHYDTVKQWLKRGSPLIPRLYSMISHYFPWHIPISWLATPILRLKSSIWYIYIYIYVHIYMHIYIYVYIYTYVYIYIANWKPWKPLQNSWYNQSIYIYIILWFPFQSHET